jgi:hypothetical protein
MAATTKIFFMQRRILNPPILNTCDRKQLLELLAFNWNYLSVFSSEKAANVIIHHFSMFFGVCGPKLWLLARNRRLSAKGYQNRPSTVKLRI